MKVFNRFKVSHFVVVNFILCLFTLHALAQKCSLDVDEVDAFTKKHVKAGSYRISGKYKYQEFNLTLKKNDTRYEWEMKLVFMKAIPGLMKKGDIISFILENEKVINLECNKDVAATLLGGATGVVYSTFLPGGPLDEATVRFLSESPIAKVRIIVAGETFDADISSKHGRNVQDIARCILLP